MNKQELETVVEYLKANDLMLTTAESVTAGLVASTLAALPGCGKWLDCAFVTYSEDAKIHCLQIDPELIETCGLTSTEIAKAMAEGALEQTHSNCALATTGLAGPSSADGPDPVGTVCFAWAFETNGGIQTRVEKTWFDGDRNEIRQAATSYALRKLVLHHRSVAE